MKQYLLVACVAVLALLLLPSAAFAQYHSVTFNVNTATVPDTINAASPVVITGGGSKNGDTVLTAWGAGVSLTNVGGDYWQTTLQLADSAQIAFKIRIGPNGWEENTNEGNGNRNLLVTQDTVLDIEFWNTGHFPTGKNIGMFDKPYVPAPDSMISVYVRVNLKAIADNGLNGWTAADQDSVCIMGGGPTGSTLDWGTPNYLTQEQLPTNSGSAFAIPVTSFYSGVVRIPKSQITPGQDIAYKFRLGSNWSYGTTQRSEQLSDPPYAGGNRHFLIPSVLKDTTLPWVYFGDIKPGVRENFDTCTVTFRTDMKNAILTGGYLIGDTIQVQVGFFNTADSTRTLNLVRLGGSTNYAGTMTLITSLNLSLDYQYYVVKNGQAVRENYYNFSYAGDQQPERERRQIFPNARTYSVADTLSNVTSDRRMPSFPSQALLSRNVRVTWTVDLRPAYYQIWAGSFLHDIQGTADVNYADSIKPWGVGINGPATGGPNGPLPVDWATWDRTMVADTSARKMYDDGTHGDAVAGDTIYSVIFSYTTANKVGQVYKFGIRGGDNEAGSGGFGANGLANISDADSVYEVDAQFGEINPTFYSAWDFNNHRPANPSGVVETGVPLTYSLSQNYPNPFNPSTQIEFTIPKQSAVTLKVFNILGQEVATLVNGTLSQGQYRTAFDAKNLATGLYIYRLRAGDFTSVKKMMLVK